MRHRDDWNLTAYAPASIGSLGLQAPKTLVKLTPVRLGRALLCAHVRLWLRAPFLAHLHHTLAPDDCEHERITSCRSICARARTCQKLIQDEPKMFSRGKAQLDLIAQNRVSIASSTIALKLLVASLFLSQ